jgi:signal transduction histidine kinase
MMDFFEALVRTEGFHPHGYCYLWKPGLIWLHVISDVLIGLAYVAIGFGLAHFVRRARGELPFSGMFVAFGVFIAACGATHFVEVWTLWTPVYWLAGGVKVVTAAASVFTAIALPPLIPVALRTITAARLSEQRRADLGVANERLLEMDALKTQFFAHVSHELRTPLSLIIGPVDRLLASETMPQDERRQLQTVRRNAELLLKHVNDLLEVASLQAGGISLEYRAADLAALARRAAAHFDSVGEAERVALRLEVPPALPAELDPDKIERVLFNLLGNAVKFTPPGGEVRCVLRADEPGDPSAGPRGRAILEVHDSGPGVPAAFRDTIFEPFRRIQGTLERRHEGTGLGLAIVADLVKLHDGTVRVEDSPLGGAEFVVELPLVAPPGTPVAPPGAPAAEPHAPAPSRVAPAPAATDDAPEPDAAAGPVANADLPLVLVVEDNVEMNRFISETLADEYRIARAFDGGTGIRMAMELHPDLIVSDLMMPHVSGEGLVRELRRTAEMDATPIVLLSARADDEMRVRLLANGAQDYLTKPFATEELRARVANWIGMRRARDVLQRALDTTLGDVEQLARQIATRNADLSNALEAARLAVQEAEIANRAKSDFLSVMSHELRTPLNAILGYAELMAEDLGGTLSDEHRGYLVRVKRSAEHLRNLVDEVLTFARLEAGEEASAATPVDVREIAEEAASLVAAEASARGLALRVETAAEPVRVQGDPTKLRQILLNLLGNAIKFTDEGEVVVSVQMQGGEAVLRVRDTGIGIEEADLGRVFDPFWQVDASRTRVAGGTGLGLTITRRLVETMRGSIEVASVPGRGTTFVVRLPAGGGAEPDPA